MISVNFTTSPSHLFPVALEIATQADKFTEEPVGKIKRYRAEFGSTPEQAELAVTLLQHLDNLKGVLVRAGGRLVVDHDAVIATLGCFISAQAGGGVERYCHKTIEIADPEAEHRNMLEVGFVAPPRYKVSCAKLLQLGFMPDPRGGSVDEQVQAEAVRSGCDWCPNFTAGAGVVTSP
ncbi:hypothetical protein LMG10661_03340 [Ralstonia syzygii subsp. syzygii]|nr:hypothetical protein LMG10661_03340 [Ralstonia syzygii subsp. syzygii]